MKKKIWHRLFRDVFVFVMMGVTLLPSSSFIALAQTEGSAPPATQKAQYDAALQDLSTVYGEPLTQEQAHAVCNLEKYMADCATIGKKYDLFTPEAEKQVDAVLNELKGKMLADLKQCTDETCLVTVATQLAKQISSKNKQVAEDFDLTSQKVQEKKAIVDTAKDLGIDIGQCKALDPDTAPVDALRACMRLVKDDRVQKYISESVKTSANYSDTVFSLEESLKKGEYQCGDGTSEGCGNFCLKPSNEVRAAGVSGIPQVCRAIAERFFGPDGVKELESSYTQAQETRDYYVKRGESAVFTTHDGKTLTSLDAIGRYMETQMREGNVLALEKGFDFMVAKGFVNSDDKDFALKMAQKVKDGGGDFDFDQCAKNPQACSQFVPDEHKGSFAAADEVFRIIKEEMNKVGIADPNLCENPENGAACVRASRAALPRIEPLANTSSDAKRIVDDLKRHVELAGQGVENRRRAEERFQAGNEFTIGDNTFKNFGEAEVFCKEKPTLCLTEGARQGFVEKDYAVQRYEYAYDKQNQFGPPVNNFPGDGYPQGRPFVGPVPSGVPFTGQQQSQSFDKDALRKQFEAWLDNPQSTPPPFPTYNQPYQPYPQQGQYPTPYPGSGTTSSLGYPYRPGPACPQVYTPPCQEGYYRPQPPRDPNDPNGFYSCPAQTACVPLPGIRPICPAIPTVSSCSTGEERVVSFSSPECGVYYACVKKIDSPLLPPPPSPSCTNSEYWSSSRRLCLPRINCSDPANSEYNTSECYGVRGSTGGTSSCGQYATQATCGAQQNCRWGGPVGGEYCTYNDTYIYPGDTNSCPGFAYSRWDANGKRYCRLNTENRCDYNYPSYLTNGANYKAENCPTEFLSPPNPGDASSCPNFAYSRWDQNGKRYCQLNAERRCDYNYPGYLTNGVNYKAESCPTETSTPSGCGSYTEKDKCVAQSSCAWNAPSGTTAGYCYYASNTVTPTCPSGQYWSTPPGGGSGYCSGGGSTGAGKCFYTNATRSGQSLGYSVWCERDYYNCHEGTSSGASVNLDGVTLGSPSNCESGWTPPSCPSGQYWSGTACVTSTVTPTTCSSGQYWDGSKCVTSTTTSPAGQKYQTWNSYGLSSSIRADADPARIESLKQACTYAPSNDGSIWLAGSGNSASVDFGMPDIAKCRAYTTPPTTTNTTTNTTTSSGSCPGDIASALGPGCHEMTEGYFSSAMDFYIKKGATATLDCRSYYISGCAVGTPTTTNTTQTTTGGTTGTMNTTGGTTTGTTNTTSGTTTSGSCPSFAHDMGGYCMLNSDTSRCAAYSSASVEANYIPSACTSSTYSSTSDPSCTDLESLIPGCHRMSESPDVRFDGPMAKYVPLDGTKTVKYCSANYIPGCSSSNTTSCGSGQYWYTPPGGGSGYCTGSSGSTTGSSCSGTQWWDSSASVCRDSCPSGQYWNGSSCVNNTTSGSYQSCSSGQYWNGTACVNTSTTDCPSGQYWNGTACVTGTSMGPQLGAHFMATMVTAFRNVFEMVVGIFR